MINSAYFAFKAILKRRSSTFFISLIWASGLFSIASIQRLDKGLTEGIVNQVENTDILIAAKGSPTQSIFANIFHIDQPTGNIQNKEAERIIKEYDLKDVRRIAYGDNYLGFRILGCDSSTWNNLNYKSFEGRYPLSVYEVLIGRKVCDLTKLKIGDEFFGAHGLVGHSHQSVKYKVCGIVESKNLIWNSLIFSNLEAVWKAHEGSDSNYTAILAKLNNPIEKLLTPRKIQEKNSVMAISPALELNNILSWINKGVKMFNSISFLFIITAIFSMFFFLQSHIKERLGDYALLVCLGASWLKIAKVVLWQNIFIGLISIILTYVGLFILWLSLDQINIFGDIIEKNYFWELHQDAYWVLGVLILAFLTSIGPWVWLQRIPLHRALADS